MKPGEYVEQILERVVDETRIEYPFGYYYGYSRGVVTFKRRDGLKIQEEDLENLRQLRYGQVHTVHGKVGDETCSVWFECDSTG